MTALSFQEMEVGQQLPPLVKKPTYVQLFRYSAVTWNTHRIHYDQAHARQEGYPDVLVQSHLHGAFLTQLCTDWMGPYAKLLRLDVNVRRFAVPGDTLTCYGEITEKKEENGKNLAILKLEELNQHGQRCAQGEAMIQFS